MGTYKGKLGDPGDCWIRPKGHDFYDIAIRESDDAGIIIETSGDVLRSLIENIAEAVDAETPPLPFECEGSELPSSHEADVVRLRQFAATHSEDGDGAA